MDNFFTFLYVRSGNAGVRSIRIHRTLAISVVVVFLALVVAVVSMISKYSGLMMDSHRLMKLQLENEELAARIRSFQTEIEELKGRMAANFELQNRARLIASLEPISQDVWQVGVGGPEPGLVKSYFTKSDQILSSLEDDLDRMVRQSELQLKSYEDVIAILEKEKKVRNSTPSIRPLRGGFLSSRFGRRMDPFTGRIGRHLGIDYCARTGTPVMSTADG
ncbi:MAG: hypothetical protein KAX38_01550, partial [Candidatus Krumholzibacteria bacterium]|nr:hypothetical protein [Candidatus Krumholzibacteria bacterium]